MGNCCDEEAQHKHMVKKIVSKSNNRITEEDIEELLMLTKCKV